MPGPNLAEMPAMDTIKIGPGGQTFGQLKDAVREARARWIRLGNQDALDVLSDAQAMLRAAYVRVGLPYVAP